MNLANSSVFMQYYQKQGLPLTQTPKFVLYSTHAETLAPLLNYFGVPTSVVPFTPDPATFAVFNFYEDAAASSELDKFSVTAGYVSDWQTYSFYDGSLYEFAQRLVDSITLYDSQFGASDLKTICEVPFTPVGPVLAQDPQHFKERLYRTFGYNPSKLFLQ